jgi:hypothetical protein
MGPGLPLQQLRRAGLPLSLLVAAVIFAWVVHAHYPIPRWLFFRYAGAWLRVLFLSLGCLAAGSALLARGFGASLTLVERLTLGLPVGVFVFGLGVFGLGVTGLVEATLLLPLLFLALGWRRLQDDGRRIWRHVFHRRVPRVSAAGLFVFLAGALGVTVLYAQVLSPQATSFDVRWYHAPLAQRYALSGGVVRLEEGFWLGAYPQLLTYIYTWVFVMPGALFDRLATCIALEVLLFVATLAQIPVLLRRLLPGVSVRFSWVVLLFFPGIYLYDSNLHGGADHFAAFFAVPIALAAQRAFVRFTPARTLLFALFLSAAALTKYSAACIVVPAALAMVARAIHLAVTTRSTSSLRALGILVGASVVLTAPHWLKNWLWYGDPLYPALHAYFDARPWNPDAIHDYVSLTKVARSAPMASAGLLQALEASVTFSFVPNDWDVLHRDWPVFGSLFTLTIPCLPFLRGARRLLPLYAAAMAAVVVWYLLNHFDRLLQPVLPWMAAATGGALALLWRAGPHLRWAAVPLLAIQCIWGLDVPFIRTHNLIHDSSLRHSMAFLATGFEQKPNRLRLFEPFSTIGASLPKDAVVLVHDQFRILGLDRNWVTDRVQGRINYGRLLTPAAIHRELVALGVTHVLYNADSVKRDSLAGDLAFLRYAENYTLGHAHHGNYVVAKLPALAPPDDAGSPRDLVALFGCDDRYESGFHELRSLALPDSNESLSGKPPLEQELTLEAARAGAELVVIDKECRKGLALGDTFQKLGTRGKTVLYARKR